MNNSLSSQHTGTDDLPTEIIKVMQEFATVTKEVVETGKVRIIKTVSEETVGINIPIVNESYEVKHVKVPITSLNNPL